MSAEKSKAKDPRPKSVRANALRMELCGPPAVATYPPGATFGPRRLVNYEFVWIIEGQVEYRWENQRFEAPPGSLILCRPPATDYFRWDAGHPTRHAYFHFELLAIPNYWPSPEEWPLICRMEEGDLLQSLFLHLLSLEVERHLPQALLAAQLLLTAFVFGNAAATAPPALSWPDPVVRAVTYARTALQENAAKRLALPQLAEAAFITPEHLCRLFQEAIGFSPLKVVRFLRLEEALPMVARTNCSMQEIALRHGFANANHFSRCFKEAYGVSPRTVRNAVRAGQEGAMPVSPLVKNKVR